MSKPRVPGEIKNDMIIFSASLSGCRKNAGMTLHQLAEKVGVTPGNISNIEHARYLPSISLYKKLCRVLKQGTPPML